MLHCGCALTGVAMPADDFSELRKEKIKYENKDACKVRSTEITIKIIGIFIARVLDAGDAAILENLPHSNTL